ncbi:phage regulatory CII family protein [Duganella sp. LjRoot269]|uniref:phage regulatory CII family protein n=1 Tax=Duganella sp. LjRoot269 TaxID=3342305 RepID=UPI003ECEB8F6
MNAIDAFHSTVHSYPGGCEALAARMGVGAAVLRNKANPNADYHKPTLADADLAMALSGNYAVLHALAQNHGHVCIPVQTEAAASDIAILELVTQVWSASGTVGAEVHATLADGIVEQHEIARVKAAVYRVNRSLADMVARLEGMAEK